MFHALVFVFNAIVFQLVIYWLMQYCSYVVFCVSCNNVPTGNALHVTKPHRGNLRHVQQSSGGVPRPTWSLAATASRARASRRHRQHPSGPFLAG